MDNTSKTKQSNTIKKSSVEEEKSKRLRERDEIIKNFENTYIYDENKRLKSEIKIKSYVDHSRYLGFVRDEKRVQRGIYYYANGDVYCGEWEDDEFHGEGTYIFAMGERYEGSLKKGSKEGQGNI